MSEKQESLEDLERQAKQYTKIILEYLEMLSDKTGMPVEQMLQILLAVCLFFTLIGTFKEMLSNCVGIIYPAFKSF